MWQHEDILETREQKFRRIKSGKLFVSKELVTSKAWLSLTNSTACQVYLIFLTKCVVEKQKIRPGCSDKHYVIINNGEIQFSYKEAYEKFEIKSGRFTKALDDLIKVGLIDITHSGYGLQKDVTLYAIGERWRDYGTVNFVEKKRVKRDQQLGFTKCNKHGRNSKTNIDIPMLGNTEKTMLKQIEKSKKQAFDEGFNVGL